ncbi:MAG: hypothetical protein JJ858_17645 [Rhizobiaceae bacterium]|nr:hypothetical protein [Rhizobiaceae bacterium]
MLSQLVSGFDLTGVSLMLILSFFLSYSIDLIMHRHGFGIWGTMGIMNIQFLTAFFFSKKYLSGTFTLNQHLLLALGIAFATILLLAFFKTRLTKA